MAKNDKKLLTLELNLETLAEFSAAAEVFGARSKSTFLNQYVIQKIREAKQTVSNEEFLKVVEKYKQEIQERSERKSLEHKKTLHKKEIDLRKHLEDSGTLPIKAGVSLAEALDQNLKTANKKSAEFSVKKAKQVEGIKEKRRKDPPVFKVPVKLEKQSAQTQSPENIKAQKPTKESLNFTEKSKRSKGKATDKQVRLNSESDEAIKEKK